MGRTSRHAAKPVVTTHHPLFSLWLRMDWYFANGLVLCYISTMASMATIPPPIVAQAASSLRSASTLACGGKRERLQRYFSLICSPLLVLATVVRMAEVFRATGAGVGFINLFRKDRAIYGVLVSCPLIFWHNLSKILNNATFATPPHRPAALSSTWDIRPLTA